MDDAKMAALKLAKKELRTLMRKKLAEVPGESVAEQSKAAAATLLSMPRYKAAGNIGVYLSMPNGEVMTGAIVRDALAERKQVFVPHIYESPQGLVSESPRKLMEMVSLHSEEDFRKIESHRDVWGIPSVIHESVSERRRILDDEASMAWTVKQYPVGPALAMKRPESSYGNLDMIVMPGVAFDRNCGRLGHGKGFYDFFLKRFHDENILETNPCLLPPHQKGMPFLVGLALSEQVMPVGQEVPTGPFDWHLDAVVTGDGSIIEYPAFDENPGP